MPTDKDVLIIGAGPTGLVLALWLTRLGVGVRIIDKAPDPGQTSRAVGVQARTLELYQQMGLAASVVERGRPFEAANFWVAAKHEARVELSSVAKGLTPFPFMMLFFPQDEHEKLLIERLAASSVQIERPVELAELSQTDSGVKARLRRPDGTVEDVEASYVAGCDGARSRVREAMNVGFPGGTYSHLFYVADVQGSGPTMNGELHGALDDADFLASFPMKDRSHARLIGTVREDAEKRGGDLDFKVVNQRVIERLRLNVEHVKWFSTYHVHHRVASSFGSAACSFSGTRPTSTVPSAGKA